MGLENKILVGFFLRGILGVVLWGLLSGGRGGGVTYHLVVQYDAVQP